MQDTFLVLIDSSVYELRACEHSNYSVCLYLIYKVFAANYFHILYAIKMPSDVIYMKSICAKNISCGDLSTH